MDTREAEGKWTEQLKIAKTTYKVTSRDGGWFNDHVCEGVPRTHRCAAAIDCGVYYARQHSLISGQSLEDIMKQLHCDPNMSITNNMKQFKSGKAPNLCQKSLLFSYFHDRVYDFEDFIRDATTTTTTTVTMRRHDNKCARRRRYRGSITRQRVALRA